MPLFSTKFTSRCKKIVSWLSNVYVVWKDCACQYKKYHHRIIMVTMLHLRYSGKDIVSIGAGGWWLFS